MKPGTFIFSSAALQVALFAMYLHSFERRHDEVTAVGVREVVVFRSTAELLQRHHGDVPYTVVLDPKGKLYTKLAVTAALGGLG